MRRRVFIKAIGSAVAWSFAAQAQQPALPVVAFVRDGSPEANARYVAALRKGLSESGYVEGQNVTVEYHWLEAQYDRLPTLLADLVRCDVPALAFVRSRRGAESVALSARRHLADTGEAALAGRVAAYRSGYLPEERRAL